MTAKRTWIVVANGAHARILLNTGPGSSLTPAMEHDFAAPHAPDREFVSDKPGRFANPGHGSRHGLNPRSSRHEWEKTNFARDLARVLETAAESGSYDRLILVAPPLALGRLRRALAHSLRARIIAELGKDLTHTPLHRLPRHLRPAVRL